MTNSPPWGPGTGRAHGAAIIGAGGHLVEAGAAISNGPDAFRILGLPEPGTPETRDRVRAAIINSGQTWPARSVTVTLQPGSLPKHGTSFDLAIAVAVLTASGVVPAGAPDGCLFIAELGLDGHLRPVRGVTPAVLAAASAGCTRAVVAAENAAEAVMVPGVAVVPCQNLRTVRAWLRGEPFPPQPGIPAAGAAAPARTSRPSSAWPGSLCRRWCARRWRLARRAVTTCA